MRAHAIRAGDTVVATTNGVVGRAQATVPVELTVEKVGRTWGTLSDRRRFSLETLEIAESSGRYRVFLSWEDYREHRAARDAWVSLSDLLRRRASPPEGLTSKDIQRAADILLRGIAAGI